jgi:hypothetical protein
MLPTIIGELINRQACGNLMAKELIERLEAHRRDLSKTIAWIRENAKAESDAIDVLLGAAPAPAAGPDDAPADAFKTDPYEVEGGTSEVLTLPEVPRDEAHLRW